MARRRNAPGAKDRPQRSNVLMIQDTRGVLPMRAVVEGIAQGSLSHCPAIRIHDESHRHVRPSPRQILRLKQKHSVLRNTSPCRPVKCWEAPEHRTPPESGSWHRTGCRRAFPRTRIDVTLAGIELPTDAGWPELDRDLAIRSIASWTTDLPDFASALRMPRRGTKHRTAVPRPAEGKGAGCP